ncbi:MAG TPA: ATP-binding protein [Isosphaeraceae bacterium]|nr:ATP-binding protein [Isosphaeraceae bacterium]
MSEPTLHQRSNAQFLERALAWLQLRLWSLALHRGCTNPPPGARPLASLIELPATADKGTDVATLLERAAAALREAESYRPAPNLVALADRLDLSRFEFETLLLCVGVELDSAIGDYCALVQTTEPRRNPTVGLALTLFEEDEPAAFASHRPLRHWRLIEVNQPGAAPLVASQIRADERIVNDALGIDHFDEWLRLWVQPINLPESLRALPESQRLVLDRILGDLERAGHPSRLPVLQLVGPDAMSKEAVAWLAAHEIKPEAFHLYRLAAEDLPTAPHELDTLSRLWARECLFHPLALYVDADALEPSAAPEGSAQKVTRFLASNREWTFLATRQIWPRVGRPSLALEVNKPTEHEQKALWQERLGHYAGDTPARLAGQFNLNAATIDSIAQSARASPLEAIVHPRRMRHRLWWRCREAVRPRLDALAQRLEPKATLRDLVLPRDVKRLLREIAAQVRYRDRVLDEWGFERKLSRGLGLSVLFAGESGTGKTMAAEALARSLRLDLFRIDLSAVVNKYIGETEKNLRRLFDAAEDGGVILFFDEADALFGKRSEVKDSHDRYANIEINYLLQRMEAYRGLAILATNMKRSLDPAFLRRLRFVVDFPFPGPVERKAIWMKAFPSAGPYGEEPHVPIRHLDYDSLKAFDLAGGSIANVALNAAFLGARQGFVDMNVILRALREEYVKLERPITESDFVVSTPAGAAR